MCFPCCSRKEESDYLLGDQAYKASPEAIAEYRIAMRFEKKRDEANYLVHMEKAAEMGLADAQLIMGQELCATDRAAARQWLQKAVDQEEDKVGSVAAQFLAHLAVVPLNQPFPTSATFGNKVTFITGFPGSDG